MENLEFDVMKYLSNFKYVYTKTLYKALRVKLKYNLSLNKFRNFMYDLEKLGKVSRSDFNSLSAWTVK